RRPTRPRYERAAAPIRCGAVPCPRRGAVCGSGAGAALGRLREIDEARQRERLELGEVVLVLALLRRVGDRLDQLVAAAPLLLHGLDDTLQAEELRVRRGLQ